MNLENKINRVGKLSAEVEILVSQRADPFIVKGDDQYYYFTGSFPMLGEKDEEGYYRIILRR